MKMLKIITFIALTFHGQSIIAMQALKAKQEKIAREQAAMPADVKPAAGAEIPKVEEITDRDEKKEFCKEIADVISDDVGQEKRRLFMENILQTDLVLNFCMPAIKKLHDTINANASKVATSNRAKTIDARSKIKLLCYVYQMFLDIDQGQNKYSLQEKKKQKEQIWSIVTSAGLNYPMPAINDVTGTSSILEIALGLPMYQEVANTGAHLPQVTIRAELEKIINAAREPIKKAYNNEADKDKNNPCSAYDYLMTEFNELQDAVRTAIRWGTNQSILKIELLITFQFLYSEMNTGCFRDKEGQLVGRADRAAEKDTAKDILWERLKKVMPIAGDRPDIPGQNWVLNILRQRSDSETRAFANPIFKKG